MMCQLIRVACCVVIASALGCSPETTPSTSTFSGQPSADGAAYLLADAPAGALDVKELRGSVENDQDVVVIGRIGGSRDPWVAGVAAFSVVDRSLAACTDIPGDKCPTPWDYCCVTDKLPGATTLVKMVNDEGELLKTDARELLGLSELQTVTILGTAQKDETGNVTILARGIYVDPGNPGQVLAADADGAHDHEPVHDHTHGHEHADEAEAGEAHDAPSTINQEGDL